MSNSIPWSAPPEAFAAFAGMVAAEKEEPFVVASAYGNYAEALELLRTTDINDLTEVNWAVFKVVQTLLYSGKPLPRPTPEAIALMVERGRREYPFPGPRLEIEAGG